MADANCAAENKLMTGDHHNQPPPPRPQGLEDAAASGAKVMDEFRRNGIVMLAKTEVDGSDLLCTGTLVVRSATLGMGPMLSWVPDDFNAEEKQRNGGVVCGSFSDRTATPECWTVVSEDQQTTMRRRLSSSGSGGGGGGVSSSAVGGSSSKVFVRPIVVEIGDLKSFRLSEDGNQLVLIQTDGTKHPPLIFLDDGPDQLIEVLKRYKKVRQSVGDENLYLLTDARIEALDESLSQLNLFDKSHTDAVWKFVSDIKKDPYTTTMSVFSKITDRLIFSPMDDDVRPEEEMADLLQASLGLGGPSTLQVTTGHREDGEFEVVTPRPRLMDDLPISRCKRNQEPLCQLDWELHFDSDTGKILELPELKEKIFRGGVEQEIRHEVWKFLLGYYDWNSDAQQRAQLRERKVEDYHRMKLQWKTISEEQENRFGAFRERKSQVEKDVSRTDRTHPFFQGPNNPNVKLLDEILMTYVMFNFDLGYVQGMSDLLAPILCVLENEVDAFWCFVGFMDRVSANFDFDQGGIKRQLSDLTDLMKLLDPDFYAYLDTRDSGNLFFCFRWLLIWFKRELAFNDVMRLWEVIWSDLPCHNFHLLVCAALMENERPSIVENRFGFSEILKHINDLSHRIDLDAILRKAEAIWLKIKEASSSSSSAAAGSSSDRGEGQVIVSSKVRAVLGLPELDNSDVADTSAASAGTSPTAVTAVNSGVVNGSLTATPSINRPPSAMSIEVIDESTATTEEATVTTSADKVSFSKSAPMSIRGGNRSSSGDQERICRNANNDEQPSSSVEVISTLDDDDEAKFQQSLASFY